MPGPLRPRAVISAEDTLHTTLVLGLGDRTRGDDGIGPHALARLVGGYALDSRILTMDAPAVGVRVLPFLTAVNQLLVIAAVRLGAPPGTLHRLEWSGTPNEFEPRLPPVRPRGIEMLRMLHYWVDPVPDLVLLGVEAMRPAAGDRLSEVADQSLDALVRAAAGELRRWGHEVERHPVREEAPAPALAR